jgi:GH15 family glucan-1,4-alpha-glucosidase
LSSTIEDYALIGDCRTAALVGKDGSIDWLCLPNFDSPACLASLVGTPENGRWRISPVGSIKSVSRRYLPETLILETVIETDDGLCKLTDFMPNDTDEAEVVRIVHGISGRVDLEMELVIRFDYGRRVPWVSRSGEALVAIAGPDLVVLRTPIEHHGENMKTRANFSVSAGQTIPFALTHGQSHLGLPAITNTEEAFRSTRSYWLEWAARCNFSGDCRDAVIRSLITLKALTYRPTGGIIAAPTTSLPELQGGTRNWDYRYCWLRDATFTLLSLMRAGYREDADAWRAWLVRASAGHPSQLQPIYSITGVQRLDEYEVPWLKGYDNSQPVRIGNDAANQLQLDAFGEVLDALHHARRGELATTDTSWSLQRTLLEHLETILDEPDHGIWEVRGPRAYFTYSRVMMWVAFDRGISAIEDFDLDGPLERWQKTRDALHKEICERAYNPRLNAFVQSYGAETLDAATLLIPMVGFLPADDPRMVGTVAAIGQRLSHDGLIRRYDTAATEDGLPPGEGTFLACSFWYVDNLVLQGRLDEARSRFHRLLAIANDVGLLSEQFDPNSGRMLGNFPQGLSHLALIDTAYNLFAAGGPAKERSKHRESVENREVG